ncbi:hypothetical protein Leryth_008607, partial [Lithospermum erythrorhizon]
TTLGVKHTPPTPPSPPPQTPSPLLHSHHIIILLRLQPHPPHQIPTTTPISLLISLPNSLLPSFAANLSAPTLYLSTHILPFHPRAKINVISLGDDVISSDSLPDPAPTLLPALRNLHSALLSFGIRTISVSTTVDFVNVMTTSFPPSSAEFQDPIGSLIIRPLLQFLDETNSCFLINVYPYNVYRLNPEIPIGYALFQDHEFNFRDDTITGLRYRNLYDMMVDSVLAAIAVMGYENIPVIVAETGWPSGGTTPEASLGYAELYLSGLVKHLRSGNGTPLRKEGAAEVYIYQLFDGVEGNGTGENQNWGIMYNNMSMKYNIDFASGGGRIGGKGFWLLVILILVSLCLVHVS